MCSPINSKYHQRPECAATDDVLWPCIPVPQRMSEALLPTFSESCMTFWLWLGSLVYIYGFSLCLLQACSVLISSRLLPGSIGLCTSMRKLQQCFFEDKSKWLRHNPVTAARHFQYRLNAFQVFIKSNAHPIGKLVDYVIRIEFQVTHAHTILWIKDAPKLGVQEDEKMCQFNW